MFLPLGDDNSRRLITPFVVFGIFAINVIVWFLELSGGDRFVMAYSAVPFEITNSVDRTNSVRIPAGHKTVALQHYPGPSPIHLTLFSSMFMHGSWMHIIGNMVYLLIFADQIEDEMGHFRFALFYLICGLAASAAHILADPQSVIPCLGASGAIAGVLGAYLVTHPNNEVRVLVRTHVMHLPAAVVLGFWIVLQFLGQFQSVKGAASGVAYMAHIGGFVAGVIFVFLFRRKRDPHYS
jgi:membrane associated rhomboid family serine protease